MAQLPRYEAKIQGTQTDVSPALQGIAAAKQGQQILTQSLNQKLGTFFNTAEAIARPIIDEKAQRAALDADEYERKSRWTMYGQAYNRAADAKYAADSAFDARIKASQIAAQNPYDAKSFMDIYQQAAAPEIAGAPTPALKVAIQKTYRDYGAKAYEKILNASMAKGRSDQAKSYAGFAEVLRNDYLAAVSQGNDGEATDKAMMLTRLQDSAINNRFVTEGEVAAFNRTLLVDGYGTREFAQFNKSADKLKYMREFRKREHPALNEEQQQKLYDKMMTSIKSDNALANSIRIEEERLEEEEKQAAVERYNDAYVSGSLNQMQLDTDLANGTIDIATHKLYSEKANDPGAKFDNTGTQLRVMTYLGDYSKQDILDLPDITNGTKMKLLAERKNYLENEGKWTATINGREARDRVRRKFNILSDTLMAKIDFTGRTMREFDQTYRAFFDRVQALPVEERESKSLQIADEVINEYDHSKAKQKAEADKERKAKEEEEAKRAADAYKNSTYGKFMSTIGKISDDLFEGSTDALDR